MSYLGRGLEQVDNISKLDNITFNGGTTYALTKDSSAFTPISSNALLVSIDGVIQQGNFTVSGTNIVFNFSPTGSNTCDFIMHYGTGVAFTPADSSITKDKTDFISTSSSSGLQIKGDGTTDGTLQLNCSQNSHGVKIKSPSHGSGQSYTLTLPTTAPASNKIMQTDGSGNLSFVDTPSGGFTLLSSLNGSGVTHANASVDSIFTSTYDIYRMVGFMAPSQDAEARITLRSGGSDVSDGNYNWVNMASYVPDSGSTTTDVLHSSHGQDFWEFGSADINSDNDSDVVAFDFTLHDPNTNMLSRTYMTGHTVFRNGGSAKLYSELFGGGRESNPNADGIKFYFSGGTMRYYRINIYGAKQS